MKSNLSLVSKPGRNSVTPEGRRQIRRAPPKTEAPVAAAPQPIVIEPPTKIWFTLADKPKREITLKENPKTYMELQVAISRYTPRNRCLLVVRNADGILIRGDTFKPGPLFYVNQMGTDPGDRHVPIVPLTWEFTKYYAKPDDWVNPAEIKRKLAAEAKAIFDATNKEDKFGI